MDYKINRRRNERESEQYMPKEKQFFALPFWWHTNLFLPLPERQRDLYREILIWDDIIFFFFFFMICVLWNSGQLRVRSIGKARGLCTTAFYLRSILGAVVTPFIDWRNPHGHVTSHVQVLASTVGHSCRFVGTFQKREEEVRVARTSLSLSFSPLVASSLPGGEYTSAYWHWHTSNNLDGPVRRDLCLLCPFVVLCSIMRHCALSKAGILSRQVKCSDECFWTRPMLSNDRVKNHLYQLVKTD